MDKQTEQRVHLRERLRMALESLAIHQRIRINESGLVMSEKYNHLWFIPRVYVRLHDTNDHVAFNEFSLNGDREHIFTDRHFSDESRFDNCRMVMDYLDSSIVLGYPLISRNSGMAFKCSISDVVQNAQRHELAIFGLVESMITEDHPMF